MAQNLIINDMQKVGPRVHIYNILHQFNCILNDVAMSNRIQAVSLELLVDDQMYTFFHYLYRSDDAFWRLGTKKIDFCDESMIKSLTPAKTATLAIYTLMNNHTSGIFKNVIQNVSSANKLVQFAQNAKTATQLLQLKLMHLDKQTDAFMQEIFSKFIFRKCSVISTISMQQSQLNPAPLLALVYSVASQPSMSFPQR